MNSQTSLSVVEALVASLQAAARFNPNDMVQPAVVLWTDHDGQWQPIVSQLHRLMPQLLTYGEYEPECRA